MAAPAPAFRRFFFFSGEEHESPFRRVSWPSTVQGPPCLAMASEEVFSFSLSLLPRRRALGPGGLGLGVAGARGWAMRAARLPLPLPLRGPWALALAAGAALALAGALFYAAGGGGGGGAGPVGRLQPLAPSRPSQAPEEAAAAAAALHLAWVLCKAERSAGLRAKAEAAMASLVARRKGSQQRARPLVLHLLTDAGSRAFALGLLRRASFPQEQVAFHDVDPLTEKLLPIVEPMQKLFSAGTGAYYSDAIFFLSIAMHRIMPKEISRLIQVDLDVEYRADIQKLFKEFDHFPEGAVIGIAREMQPVYRHLFWQYRKEHPGTLVGDPPPAGWPGFNSGVLLLDLEAMRRSVLYNSLLEEETVRQLADKYHFRGHLGDQDFFTLVGMEHPGLFHILDCTWNRQLCTWWRDHGYAEVFEHYFHCDGHVKIYHGNCNTPIPQE